MITNEQLFNEIIRCKEIGQLTDEIKRLLLKLIRKESFERLYKLPDDYIAACESYALIKCCERVLNYNVNFSDKVVIYMKIIVRSSFTDSTLKIRKGYLI
jgi:hypothetical protein